MPEPEWVPVVSSNLEAVSYDKDSRRLMIRFNNGRTYSYANVEPEVAKGLTGDISPGGYFRQMIKGNYMAEEV